MCVPTLWTGCQLRDELDIGAIRAFIAVVDAGDFTMAGRALRITRSAVGKAVIRLEERLGARLLNRSTRRVSPTSDGLLFYERCVSLLADLEEAEEAVRHREQKPRGTIKLSVPDAYGRLRILPVLQDYLLQWPEIRAEVTFSDRISDLVGGGYDLAVRIGGLEFSTGLVSRVIDRIDGVLCAAPSYLSKRGKPDNPEMLNEHDHLAFGRDGHLMAWSLQAGDELVKVRHAQARMVMDSADGLRAAAIAGLGIASLPSAIVAADLEAGRLVPLLAEYQGEPLPVYALYPDRRHMPSKVRMLIDLLVQRLAQSGKTTDL